MQGVHGERGRDRAPTFFVGSPIDYGASYVCQLLLHSRKGFTKTLILLAGILEGAPPKSSNKTKNQKHASEARHYEKLIWPR
jgi:hypothetical protein